MIDEREEELMVNDAPAQPSSAGVAVVAEREEVGAEEEEIELVEQIGRGGNREGHFPEDLFRFGNCGSEVDDPGTKIQVAQMVTATVDSPPIVSTSDRLRRPPAPTSKPETAAHPEYSVPTIINDSVKSKFALSYRVPSGHPIFDVDHASPSKAVAEYATVAR